MLTAKFYLLAPFDSSLHSVTAWQAAQDDKLTLLPQLYAHRTPIVYLFQQQHSSALLASCCLDPIIINSGSDILAGCICAIPN